MSKKQIILVDCDPKNKYIRFERVFAGDYSTKRVRKYLYSRSRFQRLFLYMNAQSRYKCWRLSLSFHLFKLSFVDEKMFK